MWALIYTREENMSFLNTLPWLGLFGCHSSESVSHHICLFPDPLSPALPILAVLQVQRRRSTVQLSDMVSSKQPHYVFDPLCDNFCGDSFLLSWGHILLEYTLPPTRTISCKVSIRFLVSSLHSGKGLGFCGSHRLHLVAYEILSKAWV